jgi:hypothetical protein
MMKAENKDQSSIHFTKERKNQMSNDPKNEKQQSEEEAANFEDLNVTEPEVEVLSTEDARAIPEGGASFAENFSTTITSSSM